MGSLFRVALVAVLLVSGCAAPDFAWRSCGDGFECARLVVPLDHTQPYGPQISLSVIRLPASGERIGTLIVNPGGPGVSGIDYARAALSSFSGNLRDRFDIVGYDPRGVGASSPVRCLPPSSLDAFLAMDATPDTPAEVSSLRRAASGFAAGCQKLSGRLLPHLSTLDGARDLDLLREALGEPRLTFLGKSYGTLLGALYADLFPGRVRALVLDGALDPALDRERLNLEQAQGFAAALAACCPSGVSDLLRRTDRSPLEGGGARPVTESLATLGTLTPLYDRTTWPQLTQALDQAAHGDGSLLLRNADNLVGRQEDGTYTNQTEANMAVNCIDGPYPNTIPAAPGPFASFFLWSALPCTYWPAKPALTPRRVQAHGAPPILVVGTTRDPATPYAWSRALASELDSGVLLTYEGDGHTAYFNGSTCVDDAVDTYLITTRPPTPGTVCPDIN
ncbi:alpha/beta hydrolase [Nonomuraea sp. NPDC050556]|uniref:alpha/beta hydrolase n=1 Tax=Nonomuraea sp. NPDC050556 TaxID=3364369 RepID=UPI00378D65A8